METSLDILPGFLEGVKIFPFFHIAIPLLIFEIPQIKKKYRINRLSLIIGSFFPDLADKLILFLKLSNGRGYFHSLSLVFICFSILFLISKRNNSISVPFLIGALLHLILDLPSIPLFYPFIMYDFSYRGDPDWISTLLTSPTVQITEIIGFSIISIIIIKNKLFRREELKEFLIPKRDIINLQYQNPESLILED